MSPGRRSQLKEMLEESGAVSVIEEIAKIEREECSTGSFHPRAIIFQTTPVIEYAASFLKDLMSRRFRGEV